MGTKIGIVLGNVLYIRQGKKVLPYIVFKADNELAVMSYYYPSWRYLKDVSDEDILGIQSIVSTSLVDKEKIIWSKYPVNELINLLDESIKDIENFLKENSEYGY